MKTRSRDQNVDSAASMAPANIVMPQTSGMPPSFTAIMEGAGYTPVKIDGARNRLPTGPLGKPCNNTAAASTNMPICRMLSTSSAPSFTWLLTTKG